MKTKTARARQTSVLSRTAIGPAALECGSVEAPATDLVGKRLGPYYLSGLIGVGGMGRVYAAEHARLGRPVAIKVLRPSLSRRRTTVVRFFREAEIVNRIRHRNIVDITDFVELDDGTAFIVMERLEGQSLSELHQANAPLPTPLILDIAGQICEALEAAHGIGVVHRDLKPGNVFICRDRDAAAWVKLLDFGIAKLSEGGADLAGSAPSTAEGAVLGTPAYMSPEQAVGETVDARSDVYSLGAILYELVCGRRPFDGDRFVDYVHKHVSEPPTPPSAIPMERRIPRKLESVILRCLAKRPEHRFSDVATLHGALADAQRCLAAPRRRALVAGARTAAAIAIATVVGGLGYAVVSQSGEPTRVQSVRSQPAPAPPDQASPGPRASPELSVHRQDARADAAAPAAATLAPSPAPAPSRASEPAAAEPAAAEPTAEPAANAGAVRARTRRPRTRRRAVATPTAHAAPQGEPEPPIAPLPTPGDSEAVGDAPRSPAAEPAPPPATRVHPAATLNPFRD